MDFDSCDPEIIMSKSSVIAKYLTVDQVLERKHGINEAQLKRVLYKSYYDQLEEQRGYGFKIRKYLHSLY